MKLTFAICVFSASLALASTDNPQSHPPHRPCTWCHVPSAGAQPGHEQTKKAALTVDSSLCLSCHDGVTGPDLSDVHFVHVGRFSNEPQRCTDCHDPHDRTGSYMQLRGKDGPETEQSAMFGFCRGCHSDH